MVNGVIESPKHSSLPNNPNLDRPLDEVGYPMRKDFEVKKLELGETGLHMSMRRNGSPNRNFGSCWRLYRTTLGRKVLSEESLAVKRLKARAGLDQRIFRSVLSKMRAEMRKKGHEL